MGALDHGWPPRCRENNSWMGTRRPLEQHLLGALAIRAGQLGEPAARPMASARFTASQTPNAAMVCCLKRPVLTSRSCPRCRVPSTSRTATNGDSGVEGSRAGIAKADRPTPDPRGHLSENLVQKHHLWKQLLTNRNCFAFLIDNHQLPPGRKTLTGQNLRRGRRAL